MLGSSFVTVDPCSHFPLGNLPYGIFSTAANPLSRPGVAIGDCVLDLSLISAAGLFSGPLLSGNSACFGQVGGAGGARRHRRRSAQGWSAGSPTDTPLALMLPVHCRAP